MFHQSVHGIFRTHNGILMTGFSFQNHILADTVSVFVVFLITQKGFCCQFSLDDTGSDCIRTHIIKLFPTFQIFCYQFPVKKDDGHIIFFRHICDGGRLCPVHQIDTDHITAFFDQGLYLFVLRCLASCRIYDLQVDGRPGFFLQSRGTGCKPAHHF